MTEKESAFFQALTLDRRESAEMLEKPSMRGIKKSVVDKYSDQAHFIYELLQNADDVGATSARFILEPDHLIFIHNGVRHFSVSDPQTEDIDLKHGTLGDINAITSIANSNKRDASIGKFGVGFKAVFQYTSTPSIYDPNVRFRIDRFIVPSLINADFPGRQIEETLFVFPFDVPEIDNSKSFSDIAEKLKSLPFPILFLSKLQNIEYKISDVEGTYSKEVIKRLHFDSTIAENVCLTRKVNNELNDKKIWLFSRENEQYYKYSVAFFMDENDHLQPVTEPAYCFFPTKEITGLNFVIHAPFLLTESREGIKAGSTHNMEMVNLLAKLAADALVYLRDIGGVKKSKRIIDDNIIKIIPVDRSRFNSIYDRQRISFLPFYDEIEKIFRTEEMVPTTTGFVTSGNAYWAALPQLTELISDSQLKDICENRNAEWAFPSIGRDEIRDKDNATFNYVERVTRTNLNEDVIISGRSKEYYFNRYTNQRETTESIKGITAPFIESQTFSWLHKFYKWLSETKHRTTIIKNKPIFINSNGKASAAFDSAGQPILFLPTKASDGYQTIHPKLLENRETREFINQIGIKRPSLRDQIYNSILPLYDSDGEIDTDTHFELFFEYYCKCATDEIDEFIGLIKNCEFIKYYLPDDSQPYRGAAETMYFPTTDLKMYFRSKPDTRFVAIEEYFELVANDSRKYVTSFLTELGVKKEPVLLKNISNGYYRREIEYSLDGLAEIIKEIVSKKSQDLSVFLWDELCRLIDDGSLNDSIFKKQIFTRVDARYKWKEDSEESTNASLLRTKPWLVNSNGKFVTAKKLYVEQLSGSYSMSDSKAGKLLEYLHIFHGPEGKIDDAYSKLTDSEKKQLEFAKRCSELGITEDDISELAEIKKRRQTTKNTNEPDKNKPITTQTELVPTESESQVPEPTEKDSGTDYIVDGVSAVTSRIVKDIVCLTKSRSAVEKALSDKEIEEDTDHDDYLPQAVDYSKKIEKAKEKSAAEIDKIACIEELQQKAVSVPKYSFSWFKTLLELETINSNETNSNSKEISISFAKVEKEEGTKRTLVLKNPNRYIPQFMEDLADIPLVLHSEDNSKTVAIEVANIKSYTLRVKLKSNAEIDDLDFSKVTEATVDAKSPSFLLDELKKQFVEMNYDDSFDMQKNLCDNIKFIFGPPGTGKTTYLAKDVLMPLMQDKEDLKVLVLTPTNKAADVLVKRLMEVSEEDTSFENWLIRFGTTNDEELEQSVVFKDKTFDIRKAQKNITVTTIARFPYDFFMPQGARIYLRGINWDYIVFDEASMVPIANILYPLYKKTPREFIIAGDPFQIEPITSVDLWKNENIYSFVHLDSFIKPKTTPHNYDVKLLTTQYRSVPSIGGVFSNFVYGGILKHYREEKSRRPLNISDILKVKSLNIIKFPVSKYESIYRAKRLQHSSSYQIFSALFTFEFVNFLSRKIAVANPNETYKIGIIAPYRAQADLIDKLISAESIPNNIEVLVGTIHGFQGDECDIIFAVFNTPPSISSSKEMFLNKENIINVSISRAKDYLFIVMPDDDTEKIDNLKLVKRVEQLFKDTKDYREFTTKELEQLMFGSTHYLEDNTFSTSHQSVNVYSMPEKIYEIRSEDTAVDIQVHRRPYIDE